MNLIKIVLTVLLLGVISFGGFIYYQSTIGTPWMPDIPNPLDSIIEDPNIPTGPVSSTSNNEFAVNLYKELSSNDESGNLFFSPFSISSAVAIAYEGAAGTTAKEIREVFGYSTEISTQRTNSYSLNKIINSKKSDVSLSSANALWVEKTFSLLPEYKSNVSKYYGGEAVNLDFRNQAEKSRGTINSWVENKTAKKIKDILPNGSIESDTKLVITNAVYFNGKWKSAFKKNDTKDMPFYISGTQNKNVQMMYQTGESSEFKYGETDGIQILEMPYKGDNIIMTVFLPQRDKLADLESKLTLSNIDKWRETLVPQEIEIYLPKFKFDTSYSLVNNLRNMGINEAFSDTSADFSGMTGERDLYIQNIFHKAFIDVYEEGTEAAASTAIVMAPLAMAPVQQRPPVFKADHPFLFMISEKETNTILFIGRVRNIN